jgi:hypothetical protein
MEVTMMLRVSFLILILVLFWGWVSGITTVAEAEPIAIWLFSELKNSSKAKVF